MAGLGPRALVPSFRSWADVLSQHLFGLQLAGRLQEHLYRVQLQVVPVQICKPTMQAPLLVGIGMHVRQGLYSLSGHTVAGHS